jgi:hypothetical protein
MICPYCIEDIKDGAIVCAHCHRDLTFFRPMEDRLNTIESQLAALRDCVSSISAFLDRQEHQQTSDVATVDRIKPGFGRMFAVVFMEVVLSVMILIAFGALIFSSDSDVPASLIVSLLVVLFLVPIGLGFWIGLTWRGKNLKRYLMIGLASGLAEIALPLFVLAVLSSSFTRADVVKAMLWIVALGLGREIFGFACGGLLGDVVEKKRHPERYGKTFSENLALRWTGGKVGRFDGLTRRLGTIMGSMTPLIPLIGVVVTTVGGYYASRAVAERKTQAASEIRAIEKTPSPTPTPSP